jgi:hypothetical protein
MILQALLALSAAHKRKILDPTNRAREGLPPDAQEIFMLKQYCGGMKSLYTHLYENTRSVAVTISRADTCYLCAC